MYSDSLTLECARREFFNQNGFSERDYAKRIAKIQLGPVPIYFYNFRARRRVLAMHDVHHILTGYDTSPIGELQLSAWELASGYRPLDPTFAYVLFGALGGLIWDRKKAISAFRRGLQSRNLYGQKVTPTLLKQPLGRLRQQLGL